MASRSMTQKGETFCAAVLGKLGTHGGRSTARMQLLDKAIPFIIVRWTDCTKWKGGYL